MKNIILVVLVLMIACKTSNKPESEEATTNPRDNKPVSVGVMILKKQAFKNEIIANGRLSASKKIDLVFEVSGKLVELNVTNGSFVYKGDIIARLDQQQFLTELNLAKVQLDNARLALEDILISQGYSITDSNNIPTKIFDIAKIKSGYQSAITNYHKTLFNFNNSIIKAPFDGVIANLDYKIFSQVTAGKTFCTIIDNSSFDVIFYVTEFDIKNINKNATVLIIPFIYPDLQFFGKIDEVNPVIEEKGLIKIKAKIKSNDKLLEGMNVKVYVQNEIPDQFVVPKSAVLIRDNKEVLFKYINGSAYWTYVNVIHENSNSYAIIPDKERSAILNEGDTIIVSNNLNLAHDSRVMIE